MRLNEYLQKLEQKNKDVDLYICMEAGSGYFCIAKASETPKVIENAEKQYREFCLQNIGTLKRAEEKAEHNLKEKVLKLNNRKPFPDISYEQIKNIRESIEELTDTVQDVQRLARKYAYCSQKRMSAERVMSQDAPPVMDLQIKTKFSIDKVAHQVKENGIAVILEPQDWDFPISMLYWTKSEWLKIDERR